MFAMALAYLYAGKQSYNAMSVDRGLLRCNNQFLECLSGELEGDMGRGEAQHWLGRPCP